MEGDEFEAIGQSTSGDGVSWYEVRDRQGKKVWAPAQYFRPKAYSGLRKG
jgi:hypothetical protein